MKWILWIKCMETNILYETYLFLNWHTLPLYSNFRLEIYLAWQNIVDYIKRLLLLIYFHNFKIVLHQRQLYVCII